MIRNYIKTAIRSLSKNKGFTAINVLGLSLGLAACLLIVFYVSDELGYDTYNKNIDNIYRVNTDVRFGGNEASYAVAPAPTAAALKTDFPEIEQAARFRVKGGFKVKKGNQNIQEDMMVYADPNIFDVFTLPMIYGNKANALKEPHTVVITERTAEKYFNSTNVVGRTLTFDDNTPYKVTGVIKNIPHQSHFNFDFFVAMPGLDESKEDMWFSNNFQTYILLKKGADADKLNAKLSSFMRHRAGPQLQSILHLTFDDFEKGGNYYRLNLTPLKKIHLYSNKLSEIDANGNIRYVYIFSAIAIFILLIACVNFMNLSTARSTNRAREVGVRKVLGSPRKYLIAQFLTESVIVTLAAAVIGLVMAWLFLAHFNQIAGKELTVTPQILGWLVPVLFAMVIIIGALAGSYPALFLSGFNPIEVLKGKLAAGFKGGRLRSFLVVFQFAISIFLIIGTLVIYNQLKYIQNRDLGYNRDHILLVKNVSTLGSSSQVFKQEIKQLTGVQNATLTSALPTGGFQSSTSFFKSPVPDQKNGILPQRWPIDADYIPTMGMKIISGRNFSDQMPTDSNSVIINETAARMLAFSNPVGAKMYEPEDNKMTRLKEYHIIGVVKDFNFKSLRENITPMFLMLEPNDGTLSIRFRSANIPALLAQVKNKWAQLSPNQEINYSFMDKDFDSIYRAEQRVGSIFMIFTTLAIIIACLGLFGLAAYATEQRTKEIGIRKVLGASLSTIIGMLSADFVKLVIIAICIASPVAWWAMNKWLQDFAYRANIQWWIVALAGAGAILIAFITISFQSIKAALANPVKSLRSE
ncbi:FtsX-like permease family protein [Mucilaginibacter corticis]|uniref:FtsX-like permease family protein n=1 Tax=Mucilaginibacter corticis TaxID=2597670 RepID=A0A556MTB8_9SPHI|nr:ABC transporter permease [Mucilaginibacter corticis]TSJ43039.1 FtsX-like permease family protein [Mucilaginibacter corticis]